MSFASLKNNQANALQSLQQKVQAAASGETGNRDPRKWKLTYDKNTKIGSATIRFLPFGAGERLPWAEWYEFSFKSKGGNYWERSLKTLGKDDPVAELNHLQWERNQGNDQDEVRKRGRRQRFVANIVVVNDPAKPENNGKVFLFEYGPAIHKKIVSAMVPEYDDQQPVPVFDMWQGATFRLRTKDKSGFLNYDDSTFDPPAPLHEDDKVLETIYEGMHDLTEFESENNYKSFEELDKQMRKVLGGAYVASVLGEDYTPANAANAAAAGGNPFPNEQASQGNVDPFAGQQQQASQGNVDPFAGTNDSNDQNVDPFAGQQQASQGNSDPFAGMESSGADANDPFANLEL